MDKLYILGSANAVPKVGQDNTHLLVHSKDHLVMVDCGDNPIAKVSQAGFSINDVTDLILTHFHADHVGSLPLLIMGMWLEKREKPLNIYGLEITIKQAKELLGLFNWQEWKGLFPVHFQIVSEDGKSSLIDKNDLKICARPVIHLIPTIGLRFSFESGKTISYSCDTEPCEAILELAHEVDVHLQESAGLSKGHTSSNQAGEIARVCGVKKLVLIHYDNRQDLEFLLSEAKDQYAGEVILAQDLMII